MELSKDQNNAKNEIIKFLNDKSQKLFILKGSAGTGKTTLITNILGEERYKDKKISLCATTHKAVSVLKEMKVNSKELDFITIHKLLKIKRKINKYGDKLFDTNITKTRYNSDKKNSSIYCYDIIIVDECSMIDKKLLDTIFNLQDKIKGKIIFIGDICQLPPVNEKNSAIFSYNLQGYELKDIMRYKGTIVNLCDDIRKLIFDKSYKLKLNSYKSNNIIFYKNTNDFVSNFVKKYKKADKDYPICICYTNKRCNYINNGIRKLLFDDIDNNKFLKDELIIFNNFYKTEKNSYYTSKKAKIKDIEVKDYNFINFKTDIMKMLDTKIEKYNEFLDMDEFEKNSIIIIKIELLEKMELFFNKIEKTDLRIYNIKLYNNDIILSIYDKDIEKYEKLIEMSKNRLRKIFTWLQNIIKILENSKNIYVRFINNLWEIFYNRLIDTFCEIDYGYCITTHKSQASTFNNIYVDMNNIIKCNSNIDESYRCLYTAITRTSKKLNILL